MRYILIREIKPLNEVIGMLKIPDNKYVNTVYRYQDEGIYVEEVSEAEYTSYEALELFQEFAYFYIGKFVTAYDPNFFFRSDKGMVKERFKRDADT